MKSSTLYGRAAIFLLLLLLAMLIGITIRTLEDINRQTLRLSNRVVELSNQMGLLIQDIHALRTERAAWADDAVHIGVSLDENLLFLMKGNRVLRQMSVATGSGKKIKQFGREFEFKTPRGTYEILRIDEDPVWVVPDWYWLEKGETVPEGLTWKERRFKGMLGKYAFRLGDGYAIHGTNDPNSIGSYVTHGCIRAGKIDLEILRRHVNVGTKVYIY